jgi:hypothetical protein
LAFESTKRARSTEEQPNKEKAKEENKKNSAWNFTHGTPQSLSSQPTHHNSIHMQQTLSQHAVGTIGVSVEKIQQVTPSTKYFRLHGKQFQFRPGQVCTSQAGGY